MYEVDVVCGSLAFAFPFPYVSSTIAGLALTLTSSILTVNAFVGQSPYRAQSVGLACLVAYGGVRVCGCVLPARVRARNERPYSGVVVKT